MFRIAKNIIYPSDNNNTMAIDTSILLAYTFGGNTVEQYLFALGAFLAIWIVLYIFRVIVVHRLEALSKKTKTDIDDVIIAIIKQIGWPFYFFVSVAAGLQFIEQPELLKMISINVALIVIAYYGVKSLMGFIDYATDKVIERQKKAGNGHDRTVADLLNKIAKGTVWIVAILAILSNLGYNISALMAGLGVGGLAVAFALQNVLADIFASFSIYFDKPFRVGDFIIIGKDAGTVERIGIKSTRILTLQGEEMVISNKELTEARIRNFKKLKKRRIVMGIGVTYETPAKKVKKIPEIIEDIFKKIKMCDLDRVHFSEFADSSLNFEIVYYLNSREYIDHMNKKQEINYAILDAFSKEKIDMAYPTRTIHIVKD